MRGLRGALWGLAAAGVVVGVADIALVATGELFPDSAVDGFAAVVIGWSFIGAGLYAWLRRPSNRVGALMTATGFGFLIVPLGASDAPALVAVGLIGSVVPYVLLVHMLLAYPTGRLETRLDRALVGTAYIGGLGLQIPYVLLAERTDSCHFEPCPENPLTLNVEPGPVIEVLLALSDLTGVVVTAGLAIALVLRWRAAGAARRRELGPVLVAGVATASLLSLALVAAIAELPHGVLHLLFYVPLATLACLPFAFLGVLLRSRLSRAEAVNELVESLGSESPRCVRDALARALGDPTLALAYWLPEDERYVGVDGKPMTLPPPDDPWRDVTPVEREGRPVAAIVHDRGLAEDQDLTRAAGAAAGLALENERLAAELRARVEELRTSRARLVEAGDRARRKLERDLHDGAQQRLVALALQLRLARGRLPTEPETAGALLDEALRELSVTSNELRELARGIHPTILTERGLGPALEALADRSPVPVELAARPGGRLPGKVESAAYFVVAEALTNVARYAEASSATVAVARENGRLDVEVRDEGRGGADAARGSGLSGLVDRLEALDGTLEVESPLGDGTIVRARIPCA